MAVLQWSQISAVTGTRHRSNSKGDQDANSDPWLVSTLQHRSAMKRTKQLPDDTSLHWSTTITAKEITSQQTKILMAKTKRLTAKRKTLMVKRKTLWQKENTHSKKNNLNTKRTNLTEK